MNTSFTRFVGSIILAASLASTVLAADGRPPSPDPVKDCPKGLVCFTTAEAAQIDRKLITLQRDLDLARVKRLRRLGWNLGIGGGTSLDPTSPVGIRADIGIYATFGFRF